MPLVLVHAVLVNAAHGNRAVVNLIDEHLFVTQEVELVGIQRLLRAVDDYIHHIAAPELDGVSLAYRPAVALFQVSRPPGNLKMMHRHRPLLGVHTCAEHGSRAEQHTHPAAVHVRKELLSRPLGLGALDKLYLVRRNTEPHQFVLDVGVDVPLIRLVGGKVAEYELCTPVGIGTYIIVIYRPCTDRSLVVRIVMELVSEQSHVESHLACHIGSNEHLRFVEVVRFGDVKSQILPLSAMRKGDQPPNHFLLLDGRGV